MKAKGSGPSVAPDVSEATASVCHDSAAVAAAGEGTPNLPSSAALDSPAGRPDPPEGDAFDESWACAPATDGRTSTKLDMDCSLPASRGSEPISAALVDLNRPDRDPWTATDEWAREWALAAYWVGVAAGMAMQRAGGEEAPAWGSGPLTEHVPGSRSARGVPGGEPAGVGGAAVTEPDASAGGEVVPAGSRGVAQAGTTASESVDQAAVRTAEAGPGTCAPGPAEPSGREACLCTWHTRGAS